MIRGAFSRYRGSKVKIHDICLFLTFSAILQLNGRLVMIPDAAVSYFDNHCLSQKFGGKHNLQGVNGSRKRRDYNWVKLKTECISRLVVPRRCFF